jgi:hypothetical protein
MKVLWGTALLWICCFFEGMLVPSSGLTGNFWIRSSYPQWSLCSCYCLHIINTVLFYDVIEYMKIWEITWLFVFVFGSPQLILVVEMDYYFVGKGDGLVSIFACWRLSSRIGPPTHDPVPAWTVLTKGLSAFYLKSNVCICVFIQE